MQQRLPGLGARGRVPRHSHAGRSPEQSTRSWELAGAGEFAGSSARALGSCGAVGPEWVSRASREHPPLPRTRSPLSVPDRQPPPHPEAP